MAKLFPDSTRFGKIAPKVKTTTLNTAKPLNDIHKEVVTGSSGTRTFTVNGQTTGTVAYNASAATIQAALEALNNLANEDVTVTGSAGGPYTLTFAGSFTGKDVLITTTPSLTGGANTATIAHPSAGVWTVTLGASNTGGTFTITVNGQTTPAIAFNASAATVQTALESLAAIGDVAVDVSVSQTGAGSTNDPYTNVFTWGGALANTMVDFRVNGTISTVSVISQGASRTLAREATQNALSSVGNKRTSGFNELTKFAQRAPKDIGDPNRIPGEDYV